MRIAVSTRAGDETFENVYSGLYEFDGENAVIKYPDALGEVTLVLRPGRLDLTRRGSAGLRLTLIPGKATACVYTTPHGSMDLTAAARAFSWDLSERGGTVEASYTLVFTHGTQENKIKITIDD